MRLPSLVNALGLARAPSPVRLLDATPIDTLAAALHPSVVGGGFLPAKGIIPTPLGNITKANNWNENTLRGFIIWIWVGMTFSTFLISNSKFRTKQYLTKMNVFVCVLMTMQMQMFSCLGVFNLSVYTTDKDVRELFGEFGNIEKVTLISHQNKIYRYNGLEISSFQLQNLRHSDLHINYMLSKFLFCLSNSK